MDDFEDRLAELRPARVPQVLWDRIQTGKRAERRLPSFRRDALSVAAAALLLVGLYIVLLPSPEPAPAALGPQGSPEELMKELKAVKHKIVFESNRDSGSHIYTMNADGSGTNSGRFRKEAHQDRATRSRGQGARQRARGGHWMDEPRPANRRSRQR